MPSPKSALEVIRRTPSSGALAKQDSLATAFGPGPWLVVSPHDDDIILGMGMLIAAARRDGIEVHAAIVSDGSMGYVEPDAKDGIVETRRRELNAALGKLGMTEEAIHWLGFPDGSLVHHEGCNRDGTGLGQKLTALLRSTGARVAFGPTARDLHPDHRVTSRELDMACCWAGSEIWLELGDPLPPVRRFNYAVYCGFPSPPEYQVRASTELFETKLRSLECFESQRAIAEMVARLRADGPLEYIHEAHWEPYRPQLYEPLFSPHDGTQALGTDYQKDCESAATVLERWPAQPWTPLLNAVKESHETPMMIVAEGSSRLFPAGFSRYLIRRLSPSLKLQSCGGREATTLGLDSFRSVFISNSGRTSELITAAQGLQSPNRAMAIISQSPSPLGQLIQTQLVNEHPHERVVPATVSVLTQTLHLAHAILDHQGKPLALHPLREAILRVQTEPLSDELRAALNRPAHIWCVDSYGAGLDLEISLKSMEVVGVPSTPLRDNLALHGPAEAIAPGDLILVNQSPDTDTSRLSQLAEATSADLVTLGPPSALWPLPDLGLFSPLVQLVATWRLLGELALQVGHDPDHPQRITKIADHAF